MALTSRLLLWDREATGAVGRLLLRAILFAALPGTHPGRQVPPRRNALVPIGPAPIRPIGSE